MAKLSDIPFIDIFDPDFSFSSQQLREARERHWYARTPLGVLVLRYKEAVDILSDCRLSPTGNGHLALHGITSGPIHRYLGSNMSSAARESHLGLRTVLAPFLSPRKLVKAREFALTTARDLAEGLRLGEPTDLMAEFANPLALAVFCHVVQLPVEEIRRHGSASADVGLVFALSLDDAQRTHIEHSLESLFEYIDEGLTTRRNQPGTDIMSALHKTELTVQQQTSFLISIIMGGHDAPMHQLGCALVALSEHPEQWQLLAEHPHLISGAAEESLRWSPHTHTMRFALEELTYQDLELGCGDVVAVCNRSANRDPVAFENPDTFDAARPRGRLPLAFGGGQFFCPGSGLGKIIMEVGIQSITERFAPPTAAGEILWRPVLAAAYGPRYLPLSLQER